MNGKIVIFGGKGGLGTQLEILLQPNYLVTCLSSKDCDITEPLNVYSAIAKYDPDIVINMAVKNIDGYMDKHSSVSLDAQTDVNINGMLYVTKYSLEHFKKKQFGRLILLSSVLAVVPSEGTSVYSASKAFTDTLVKAIAKENASHGITCNSIQLGYFAGGLAYKIPKPKMDEILAHIPLHRLGTSEELAMTIEFVIKTEYLTGTNLLIAGGL